MKQILLKTWLILVCLLTGAGTMWAEDPVKCTSTSDLVAGSVYYISGAGTYSSTATVMGLSTGGNNFPASTFGGTPCELTLGGDATNGWTFSYVDGSTTYYLDPTNTTGSNYLKRNTSVTNYGKFTISFSDGAAVITSKGKSSRNILRYNSSSSCYSCYSSGQGAVYLYKKENSGGTAPEPTTTYNVTIANNIENGTVTASTTSAAEGATVTLTATPATGYEFGSWNVTDASSNTITVTDNKFTMPAANVNVSATFNAIPTHSAYFYVNGQQYGETQSVAEGSAITFPAENPFIDDVVFIGWAESEISGTQDNAPTLVTSKNMGNADVKLYGVFATANGSGSSGSYTLDYNNESALSSSTAWGSYGTAYEYTASDGSKWVVKGYKNKGIQLNTGKNASIKVPDCPGAISSVVVTGGNVTYYFSESDYTGSNGSSIANAQGTTATIDLSGKNVSTGYIYTSASSAVTKVVVNYGSGTSYSDYCTTVSSKATATLSIAEADKNIALGYNETKKVTISVNEAEYDGALIVASSNENVATVSYEGTIATITYVGEGKAYISVTAPSTTNYYAINEPQAIKVTATDGRQVADVAINPATISVDNGSSAEYTITTAYDGTISAVSNEESVATVSYNEGKVTVNGVSVGTAILTISGEGNATYKPFSKDFAITVNKVVPVGIKNLRTQITSTSSSSANDYEARLVDAVVTYVSSGSSPTIYIEDAEAGVAIYAKNTGLAVGDKLNGVVSGKGYIYSGLTELTSITGFEKSTGATVPCTEVTLAQLEADGMDAWESRRVVVKGLTITTAMSSRSAMVNQNGNSIKVYEKASAGCTGKKLADTNYAVASIIGYFQDNNSINQLGVWSEADITLAEKADAQVVFDLAEGTGTNENPVAFTIGEDNTFPIAVVKDSEGNVIEGATVTYSTSNGAYISVDAETGVVTLKKYASKSNDVHVTATFAGNTEYKSATADYYMTIAKGTPVICFAEENVSAALDATGFGLEATTTKGEGVTIKYTSSNPAVASFANENNHVLTLCAEGTTTISAQTVGNDTWKQSDKVSYTLTVTAPAAGYAYVTLDACGNDVEGYTEPLKVVKGRTVSLPVATTVKDDYAFLGWTSKEVTKTTTAPVLEDNEYVANADVTLYPVFSKEESDGEPETDTGWVLKGLNELDLEETVLIISTSGSTSKILSGDQETTTYFTGRDVTVENNVVTSDVPASYEWTMAENGGNYDFTSNYGYLFNKGCSFSNHYERWALSANGEKTYSMESLGGSPYNHSGSYVYLDNKTWNMTTDAALSKIQFFQVDEYDVPGSTTTYYVSRTMNILELNEDATEIAEIYDEYDKVIVHRTIKAGNWNTLCLPFAMNATQIAENFGSDAEVKILAGLTVNGESYTMHFEDCDEIDAALPCMIRVSSPLSTIIVEGNVMVNTVADAEDSANDSSEENLVTFVGSYAKTTVPMNEGNYIISSNKFYYVDSDVTNKGFRGYFNLFSLDANSSRKLSFDFGGTITDIENVNIEGLDDNIFDLQGRRVQRFQKGVNIVNGRKVIR